MTSNPRTHRRDRGFARVRRLSRVILLGSGVTSAALVGIFAATAKPESAHGTTPSTSTATPSNPSGSSSTSSNSTSSVPSTTTTQPTCYTSPSGIQNCY